MYYVHTYMTFQYKSILSGRTIKGGGWVKPSFGTTNKNTLYFL